MRAYAMIWQISIHALREEGDPDRYDTSDDTREFLSTPSARRATIRHDHTYQQGLISIHALREEGDHGRCRRYHLPLYISIHALREEGDSPTGH